MRRNLIRASRRTAARQRIGELGQDPLVVLGVCVQLAQPLLQGVDFALQVQVVVGRRLRSHLTHVGILSYFFSLPVYPL